jgi:hypothetical protein
VGAPHLLPIAMGRAGGSSSAYQSARRGAGRAKSATEPEASDRPRAQLPGGSGYGTLILAQLGGQADPNVALASQVSCSAFIHVGRRMADLREGLGRQGMPMLA